MRKAIVVSSLFVAGAGVLLFGQAQSRDKMIEQIVADTKFRTQPGFVIERVNPPGKNDSYVVLTFDAEGRPVVAKEYDVPLRLLDKDSDGIYESEQVITDKLNTCQGLWFDGPTMYANCHATQTEQEVAQAQADMAAALANQTPVRGSTVRVGGGGGGRGGGAGAAGAAGAAGRGAAPAGGRGGGGAGQQRINGPSAFFKVVDANGDGVGDSVEKLAQLVGGVGDHGPHAIRRGPDGSMMIMLGNNGGTPLNQYLDPDSLILGDKEAQFLPMLAGGGGGAAGGSQRDGVHSALFRYDPKSNKYYAVSGGNRNTYDFTFNLVGEAFWYDSDHEPEIGVPWYRQVRSVHGIPGGNYGYRNGTGKYPPWYIDSLPPLRDLDRGSPVGMETYLAYAYPRAYFDMVLEADWSRGRLLFNVVTPKGGTYTGWGGGLTAPEFVYGEPLNITDLEVGPDGMVYFTTGGRATTGGFWRIRYTGARPPQPDMSGIFAVVRQPQPLSSWAWANIERVKATMGEAAFGAALEQVARSASADPIDRVRALYETARHGPAPGDALLQALVADGNASVRAAAVYVAGRRAAQTASGAAAVARAGLKDADPLVRRRALEAIVQMGQRPDRPSVVPVAEIYALLNDRDRFVRWSARIALERSPRAEWADRVLGETNTLGVMEGMLAWVRTANGASLDPVLQKQFQLMKNTQLPVEDKLRLLRTFHFTTTEMPSGLDPARREQLYGLWANQFPAADDRLNREIALTLAYSQQPGAIEEILAAMPRGSEKQELQQQYLYALRTIPQGWARAQKMQVADIFARTASWRGGMGSALGQMWESFMEFYSPEEQDLAYQRAPNFVLYRPDPAAVAAANAASAAVAPGGGRGGRGGGGGGGGRGGGPVLLSKEEQFDSLLYRADRRGGDFGGRNAPADPAAGQAIFERQCASCHKAGAVGVAFGPDLTGTKLNRREILEAIFWPSRKVDEKYHVTVVETADGKTIRGLLLADANGVLRLKTSDAAQPIEVQKAQVRSQRREATTIMPELFDKLGQNEFSEIVAFLQASGK
jgi:putative heme-binding domain-containing protein